MHVSKSINASNETFHTRKVSRSRQDSFLPTSCGATQKQANFWRLFQDSAQHFWSSIWNKFSRELPAPVVLERIAERGFHSNFGNFAVYGSDAWLSKISEFTLCYSRQANEDKSAHIAPRSRFKSKRAASKQLHGKIPSARYRQIAFSGVKHISTDTDCSIMYGN